MSSFRCCVSDVSQRAVAHCRDSSLAMASPSKKSLRAEERKRADVARARRRWIREQGWLDTTRLVFIDETAITTSMVRLNGWSPCGERLVADAPMGHWETVTCIAGLRQTGIVAPASTGCPLRKAPSATRRCRLAPSRCCVDSPYSSRSRRPGSRQADRYYSSARGYRRPAGCASPHWQCRGHSP